MKLVFLPISVAGGLVAGVLGRKTFESFWRAIDDEEAPDPKHRQVGIVKLAAALLVEGAIFRLIRGFVDHHSRRAFAGLTGTWPGQEEPEPE